MTTHSSILAWRIPWTEEPGGLQSLLSQRVRQDRGTEHDLKGYPDGSAVKNSPADAGDTGSIQDPERSHMPQATKPVCHNY